MHLECVAFEDDAVFLAAQDCQCLLVVVGSYAHLKEDFVHLFGHLLGNGAVGDEHSAERRHGVARQSGVPCLQQCGPCGQAAGVVVFQYGEGGVAEVVNQTACGIDVAQVVVRDFLAVQLGEVGLEVAVEISLLVGILAVAQHVGLIAAVAECVDMIGTVEIVEDGCIIVRTDAEGVGGKAMTVFKC